MRKKDKQKLNTIISLNVYPFDIMFSFGETDKELNGQLKKNNIKIEEACLFETKYIQGRFVMFKSGASLIRLPNIPKTSEQFGYLQHEIFHAVTYILNKINIKMIIGKSDESYAYLIGYVTSKICHEIFK